MEEDQKKLCHPLLAIKPFFEMQHHIDINKMVINIPVYNAFKFKKHNSHPFFMEPPEP